MITKGRYGFTIIEFLIATAILLIAIVIAVEITITLNKDYKILMTYMSSYLKGREVIDIMSKDCRMAARVMDQHGGYTTTNNCLVLKVPSVNGAGDIIDVNNEFDYVIYFTNNGNLWRVIMPGGASARLAENGIMKEGIESLYIEHNGTPLSGVAHKSSIPYITMWVSISESVQGTIYTISPGTTVKHMNYEWEFVR